MPPVRFKLKDSCAGDRARKPWHDSEHVVDVASASTFTEAQLFQLCRIASEELFVESIYIGQRSFIWEEALRLACDAYNRAPGIIHSGPPVVVYIRATLDDNSIHENQQDSDLFASIYGTTVANFSSTEGAASFQNGAMGAPPQPLAQFQHGFGGMMPHHPLGFGAARRRSPLPPNP